MARRNTQTKLSLVTRTEPVRQCYIYVRVSSEDQKKRGYSPEAQYDLLREYAARMGFEVLQEFEDTESAKSPGREYFTQMMEQLSRIPEGERPHVVAEKTDRLYRNFEDYNSMDKLHVDIHMVKEGVVHKAGEHSSMRMMHAFKVLGARQYVENLSEESRKGTRKKAQMGGWPNKAPFGYKNTVGINEKKIVVPHPERAPIVRRMFELYASGNHSINSIAVTMRRDGVPMPKALVYRTLTNPFFYGEFILKGQTYQGTHEPIITRELWDRCQAVMTGAPSAGDRTPRAHEYPFAGVLKCGHCGCSITINTRHRGKKRFVYYRCTHSRMECPGGWEKESLIDEQFQYLLESFRLPMALLEALRYSLRIGRETEQAEFQAVQSQIRQRLDKLQRKLSILYADRLDERIDGAEYDRLANPLRAEQDSLRQRLDSLVVVDRQQVDLGMRLLELASGAHTAYLRRPMDERQPLVRALVQAATWTDGRLEVTWREPFNILATIAESGPDGASGVCRDRFALTRVRNPDTARISSQGLNSSPNI